MTHINAQTEVKTLNQIPSLVLIPTIFPLLNLSAAKNGK